MKLAHLYFNTKGPDIYDDNDETGEMSSTLNPKNPANKPSQFNSQSDDSNKHEYADESENYQLDDPVEEDGGHPDENNLFPDENSSPTDIDLNQNKNFDTPPSTNSRLPFVPASLWRDLFTKPGILVGKLLLLTIKIESRQSFYFVFKVLSAVLSSECCQRYFWSCLLFTECVKKTKDLMHSKKAQENLHLMLTQEFHLGNSLLNHSNLI